MDDTTAPRVFLSYSWDSSEHQSRALALADRLRAEGVDAWLDQYTTFPEQGWPRWMVNEIEQAQFVVVIATENYAQRFAGHAPTGTGLGATWEGAIITQDLYEASTHNTKFLPAFFRSEDAAHIPKPLRGYTHFRLADNADYDRLYRHITGQPEVMAGALGQRRTLPQTKRGVPLPALPARDPTAVPIAVLNPLHQLPTRPNLTGREDELADLERAIVGGAAGMAISGNYALQGMGGVGKTALAVELGYRLKHKFPDAQLFLDLRGADREKRPPVPPADAMSQIIRKFHPEGQLPDDMRSLGVIYWRILEAAGAVLLLLDDAADEAQVAPLLPPANCLLLVTSRAHLVLDDVVARDLNCLTPENARCLLLRHAGRLGALADEAAKLCGCLPLALRAFAATVEKNRTFTTTEWIDRLRRRRVRMDGVNAAFDVSDDSLSEPLRQRWRLLSVFTASFDAAAAAAVWDEADVDIARDELQSLVNSSLVEWNETARRYRLHDLVREFCAGKLSSTDANGARLRHALHYIAVADSADALYLRDADSVRLGLNLFDAERAHLDAAFAWLSARADDDAARMLLLLVNAVVFTGEVRFHPRERVRWLEAGQHAAQTTGDRAEVSRTLNHLGVAHAALGDADKAIDLYEQALIIARDLGDRRSEGAALGNLGMVYGTLNDVHKAVEFLEKRLVIAREIGDRRGESNALGNLGNVRLAMEETSVAIDLYEKQLEIIYEIGDRRARGATLGNLGNAYAALGDARMAIGFYEQQLHIAHEIGDRRGEGNALWNWADELWKLGEWNKAIVQGESALTLFDMVEDPNASIARTTLAQWRSEAAARDLSGNH